MGLRLGFRVYGECEAVHEQADGNHVKLAAEAHVGMDQILAVAVLQQDGTAVLTQALTALLSAVCNDAVACASA
jgi:hypothetical protein